jgi:pSer/pThr/pTyr-binding forkhead associated (FHA) protein
MSKRSNKNTGSKVTPPPLWITIEKGDAKTYEHCFSDSFRIGRDADCQVLLNDNNVSRFHAEVFFKEGRWWVRDLDSTNGTYIGGKKIEIIPLGKKTRLSIAKDGPVVSLTTEKPSKAGAIAMRDGRSVTQYIQRYFIESPGETVGQHTMFIRRAYDRLQEKQKRKYGRIIIVVAVLFLAAGAYSIYKHRQIRELESLAMDIFYSMKSLDIELASLEKDVVETGNRQSIQAVREVRTRRKEMEENYDEFIGKLGVYDEQMSEEERIIFRIARIFGECELTMPDGFVQEIHNYIGKWQSSDRLQKAIERAVANGYDLKISETMLENNLPPQFFYLALQESEFYYYAAGPETRYGIAKGIWQFIPKTAAIYGLRTGPLVELRRYDPRDDRYDFDKATIAAARYLTYIYSTDAQASGLLVIASYNWGETKVEELLHQMPENPRERNFWRLLENYKDQIPRQTYDYVFRIVSAAVIGENPGLFGFDFTNPLAHVEESRARDS